MTLKPVRVLVQWRDGTIHRLNEISDTEDGLTAKQVTVLEDIYPRLWKLFLFLRPDLRSRGYEVQREFHDQLKEHGQLSAICDPALQTYLETSCSDYKIGKAMEGELWKTGEFLRLDDHDQIAVRLTCHGRLPIDAFDDRFAEPSQAPLASRREDAVSYLATVRNIISTVMSDFKKKPSGRGNLPLDRNS